MAQMKTYQAPDAHAILRSVIGFGLFVGFVDRNVSTMMTDLTITYFPHNVG